MMKIRVYHILSGEPAGIYTLTYEGDSVTIDSVVSIIQQAKRKFNIAGKMFTILAGGKVFHVVKIAKKWKAYELEEANNEEH